MALYTRTEYDDYVELEQTGPCLNQNFQNWASPGSPTHASWTKHETVPRIRPSDLIANPTALPLQYTKLISGGLKTDGWYYAGSSWCVNEETGKYGPNPYYRKQRLGFFPPVGSDSPPMIDTNWALPLRLKIKDTKVNLGTSLVEYRQTSQMLDSFQKGLRSAWSLYRGRLPKHLRRKIRPCDIPASYLTATYGIEPLIGDLMDSIHVLTNRLQKPLYQRFSVKTKKSEQVGDIKWTRSDKAVCYLRALPDSSEFTLGNVGELAWEVIPFSFVVDWGVGVGDYLSSLDALQGFEFISGTLTTKIEGYGEHQYTGTGDTIKPAVTQYNSHERTVFTSVPLPARPRLGFSGSWRRLTNAVSLLWAVNDKCRNGKRPLIR